MKIVCIGNSIVNGFPLKRSQCFVSLWRQASGHELINKGENGDISSNIYMRFQKDVIAHKPDQAVVLTGTNDFIQKISTPEEVLIYMDKMTALAKKNSIEIIFMTPLLFDAPIAKLCWMPDIDYNLVNENLKALRTLMLKYGEEKNIKIVDTQEQFYQLYTEETASEYLCDGLHPTALGHEAMARFLQD